MKTLCLQRELHETGRRTKKKSLPHPRFSELRSVFSQIMPSTADSECEFHPRENEHQKRGDLRCQSSDDDVNARLYLITMEARRGYSATDALENQVCEIAGDEDDEDAPWL